jgi:hypothetical protein
VRLRDATAEDLPFLHAMLYEAAEWRPGDSGVIAEANDEPRPPLEDVLARPEIAQYLDGWPRPGDSGVIAEANDEPLGAAWYRFFTSDAPAYGFVDETIPELGSASGRTRAGAVSAVRCSPSCSSTRARAASPRSA